MNAFIKGISYYLPEKVVTNEDLVAEFPEWDVEKVYNKVGVKERHLAGESETAGDLAEKAALKLFQEWNVSPSEIDFLLLCTQSPDYHLPSTACILQDRLGIPTSAGAFDYDLGCSGCIYGMAVAKGLIAAGLASNILLLTAETYTRYLHPDDKSNRTIFGDGAAACLISKEKGLAEFLRVLKAGGKAVILELSVPQNQVVRWAYDLYFSRLLPRIGGAVSGDRAAYRYLPASVHGFPAPKDFCRMMEDAGFRAVRCRTFTFGLCRMFVGER